MKTDYKKAITLLDQLQKEYPSYTLGRHIASITADYGDVWGMTDKEFVFAITKYKQLLELDGDNLVSDDYVEQIKRDAEHLFDKVELDEEDDY